MAALHGYQAESELFRGGGCEQDDEEADYEEYQRRMRQAAKAKAPPRRNNRTAPPPPPREPEPMSTQICLEKEHAARLEARARLEEREARVYAVFTSTLGNGDGAVQSSEPVSLDEMREELRSNERANQADAVAFVGAYGR